MSKKRKKSLVGWASCVWDMDFSNKSQLGGEVCKMRIPEISTKKKFASSLPVKIRIIIEEL